MMSSSALWQSKAPSREEALSRALTSASWTRGPEPPDLTCAGFIEHINAGERQAMYAKREVSLNAVISAGSYHHSAHAKQWLRRCQDAAAKEKVANMIAEIEERYRETGESRISSLHDVFNRPSPPIVQKHRIEAAAMHPPTPSLSMNQLPALDDLEPGAPVTPPSPTLPKLMRSSSSCSNYRDGCSTRYVLQLGSFDERRLSNRCHARDQAPGTRNMANVARPDSSKRLTPAITFTTTTITYVDNNPTVLPDQPLHARVKRSSLPSGNEQPGKNAVMMRSNSYIEASTSVADERQRSMPMISPAPDLSHLDDFIPLERTSAPTMTSTRCQRKHLGPRTTSRPSSETGALLRTTSRPSSETGALLSHAPSLRSSLSHDATSNTNPILPMKDSFPKPPSPAPPKNPLSNEVQEGPPKGPLLRRHVTLPKPPAEKRPTTTRGGFNNYTANSQSMRRAA